MKGRIFLIALVAIFVCGAAYAQSMPSSKAAINVGNVALVQQTDVQGRTILKTAIKTANTKDLLVAVSLECGLYTQTKVTSKSGTLDTSSALAGIRIKVLVDGYEIALPKEIVFAERAQTLSAKLGGIQDANGDG